MLAMQATILNDHQKSSTTTTMANKIVDLSPEMQTIVEVVSRVLNECIEKLKISILLPKIFNQWKTVCRLLRNTEYENCAQLLQEIAAELKREGRFNFSAKYQTHNLLNEKLVRVVDAFQENHKMLTIIGNSLEIPSEDLWFVNTLQTLSKVAQQRLMKEPRSELLLEKRLHMFYHENKNIKNDIHKFASKIMRSRNSLRWRIASKEGVVVQMEKELDSEQSNFLLLIDSEERKLDKKQQKAQFEFQYRQKEIVEEVERNGDTLAKTLKLNFKNEQEVRAERNKLLLQLQSLLKRHDTGLAEKYRTKLMLDKELNELQQEFDDFFKNKYEPAEEVHSSIVQAIERKKRREFEMKLANFVGNRAAKIIQRAWRHFIQILREERSEPAPKSKTKK